MLKKIIVPIGIVVLVVVYYLASPLFYDTKVDEPLPEVVAVHMETKEDRDLLMEMQALTPEKVADMPMEKRKEMQKEMEELGKRMPDSEVKDDIMNNQAAKPALLKRASFVDADSFHKGSGVASVYKQSNGAQLLRLESFSVTNGPALHVYLTKARNGDIVKGFVDLGRLKGNKGNQNYPIPQGVDATEYGGVIIWCKPFGVLFSKALFVS